MGKPVPISLGTKSNPSRLSKQASDARLINCYAEPLGDEGKTQWAITAAPGLANFGTALGDSIRAMLVVGSYLYVVAGFQVFKVDSSGVSTSLGGFATSGAVYMRHGRTIPVQIALVAQGLYYVIQSDVLTQITDSDLPPPTGLGYLDGYGVLTTTQSRFFLTGLDDFTTIDPLDVAEVQAVPDAIIAVHELGREVIFFCESHTEWWQDTGNADFPFERSQSVDIGWLSVAADAIVSFDLPDGSGLVIIGVCSDHSVRMLRGYGAQVISTPEIENLIRLLDEAGNASQLTATSWSWGGRNFYCLSCDGWTRVFNGKDWHERKSYGSDRWRVSKVVNFAGKLIAGDATTGQLYTMNDDTYDEAGHPLVMEIITPPVHAFPYRGIMNTLYIDAASGVGLNTTAPQNLDPTMMLDISRDGGDTFAVTREIALGELGQTAKRLQPERRLGTFGQKGVAFRFRISAAVQKLILAAALDFDKLAA